MPASHVPQGMPGTALLTRIIGGESWQAKDIRSNNTKQQCCRLARFFRQPSSLARAVRPASLRLFTIVAKNTTLLNDFHPHDWDATAVLTRLAWYEPCWLRPPETWPSALSATPEEQWRGLVRHLLASSPLPRFFESAWLTFGTLDHLERSWYCHAGRGKSMRTAPGMPPSVSSRALHLAMQCGPDVTIRQAIRLGQLRACAASPALTAEVLTSRMIHDFSNDAVWSILIQKVAAAPHAASGTFGIIADTLVDTIKREGLRRAAALLRLPLQELFRYSVRWWEAVAHSVAASGWTPRKMDIHQSACRWDLSGLSSAVWPPLDGIDASVEIRASCHDKTVWMFRELASQVELLLEGRSLRHCVATYRKKCESGVSSIFSLRCQDREQPGTAPVSQVTLEIHRARRRIVQIRGKWNRPPTPLERELISQWATLQNLTLAA